jgi:hypothetical protein
MRRASVDAAHTIAAALPRPATNALTTVPAVRATSAAAEAVPGVAGDPANAARAYARPMRCLGTPVAAGAAVPGIGKRIDAGSSALHGEVRRANASSIGGADAVDSAIEGTTRRVDHCRVGNAPADPIETGRSLAFVRLPATDIAPTAVLGIKLILVKRNTLAATFFRAGGAHAAATSRIAQPGAAISVGGAPSPDRLAPLSIGHADTDQTPGASQDSGCQLLQNATPRDGERTSQIVEAWSVHRVPTREEAHWHRTGRRTGAPRK